MKCEDVEGGIFNGVGGWTAKCVEEASLLYTQAYNRPQHKMHE